MENKVENKIDNTPIKLNFTDGKYATGKRKESIARVWIKKGTGNIFVNNKKMIDYFKTQKLRMGVSSPLSLIKREGDFDIIFD